uniref:Uncharacterized protein n=1 Tax=Pygocentrus nattereri TaxID=42514 RepID=A0A3B4DJW8_PYGNA
MPGRMQKSMGMCLPCLGGAADDVVVTPDPETRRRQLAEAAEKRQKESTYRGIKNPEAVEKKKKKQEEMEKQAMSTSPSGGGGLKVNPVGKCTLDFNQLYPLCSFESIVFTQYDYEYVICFMYSASSLTF